MPCAEVEEAARRGAVVFDRSVTGRLHVRGPDAAAFLDAHLTAEVGTLRPGTGRVAALLSPRGTLVAIVRVLRARSAFMLDCDRAALPAMVQTLHHGTVGRRVVLERRTLQVGQLSVRGPRALAITGAPPLPEHTHRVARSGRTWLLAVGRPDGVDLRCAIDRLPPLLDTLRGRGAVLGDDADWQLLRVLAGEPSFDGELDERTLPADVGLVGDVVSLAPRLYPGMQTTLRQQRSGTVHRALRGLVLGAPAAAGDAVRTEQGDAVGSVGTAAVSAVHGPLALAVLRRTAAPGAAVTVGDGAIPATVCDLAGGWPGASVVPVAAPAAAHAT